MKVMDTVKNASRKVEEAFIPSPDKNGDVDILDKLKKEHREVAGLLHDLVETKSASKRITLLAKIKSALVPHTRAEEKVVYDAVIALKSKEAKTDGEEGMIEHDLADKTLAMLEGITDASSPQFTAAAKVLKELVEHHIKEEESNVWDDVTDNFSAIERLEMNREFEAEKKKVSIN